MLVPRPGQGVPYCPGNRHLQLPETEKIGLGPLRGKGTVTGENEGRLNSPAGF